MLRDSQFFVVAMIAKPSLGYKLNEITNQMNLQVTQQIYSIDEMSLKFERHFSKFKIDSIVCHLTDLNR